MNVHTALTRSGSEKNPSDTFHVHYTSCHRKGRQLFLRYTELYKAVEMPPPGHAPSHIQVMGKNLNLYFSLHVEFAPILPGYWVYRFNEDANKFIPYPDEAKEYLVFVQDDSLTQKSFP